MEGDDLELTVGLFEVAETFLDGFGGFLAEDVVEVGQAGELNVFQCGEFGEQGGEVEEAGLDVVDLDHLD